MALIPGQDGQQPPEEQPQPGQPQGQPQAQPADPKVVVAFQRIVLAAGKMVYDKTVSRDLVQMIGQAEDPTQGVAKAVMTVLDQLHAQVKGINPNFVYSAASVVVGFVLELAEAAKLVQFDKALPGQVMQIITEELKQRSGAATEQPAAKPETEPGAGAAAAGAGAQMQTMGA